MVPYLYAFQIISACTVQTAIYACFLFSFFFFKPAINLRTDYPWLLVESLKTACSRQSYPTA